MFPREFHALSNLEHRVYLASASEIPRSAVKVEAFNVKALIKSNISIPYEICETILLALFRLIPVLQAKNVQAIQFQDVLVLERIQ